MAFHLSLALALVAVAACGIKPSGLTPPPPAKKADFPRTYPDPSTDPKPQQESPQQ
jgi:predicted small lipoprotein YifL